MSLFAYILVTLLLVLFVLFQFYPLFKMRANRGKPSPSLDGIPGLADDHPERILLYFMSPSCGMCRNTTIIIDELAEQRNDVVRIDASVDPELAQRFEVMGTPAFVVVDTGMIEKAKLGALSRAGIMALLDGATPAG